MVLGVVIGVWMGRSRRVDALDPAGPRRAADHAGVRLPRPRSGALRRRPVPRHRGRGRSTPRRSPSRSSPTASAASRRPRSRPPRRPGSNRWQMISKVQLPMSQGVHGAGRQPGPALRAVDGRHRRPGRRRRPRLPRRHRLLPGARTSARGWPPASPSPPSASCSTASPSTPPPATGAPRLPDPKPQRPRPDRRRKSASNKKTGRTRGGPGRRRQPRAGRLWRRRHRERPTPAATPAPPTAASSTWRSTPGSATRRPPTSSARSPSSELGCDVEYKDLKEEVAWQGFGTGEVDVVIENWGHDGPEEEVHRRAGDRRRGRPERQHRRHRLVRAAVAGRGSTRTSPTGRTSTSTPTSSRRPSPVARASCSTATRRSSPTTRRWSRTSS